eukprot:2568248-Ditylum_brightwellii.AAC.1
MVTAWPLEIGQAEVCRYQSIVSMCQQPTILIMPWGTLPMSSTMMPSMQSACVNMSEGQDLSCGQMN